MEIQKESSLPAQVETTTEIELSAEDVLNLSGIHRAPPPRAAAAAPPPKPARRFWRSPVGLAATGTVLCLALGAGYGIGISNPDARPPVLQEPPVVDAVEVSVKALAVEPVRIRNPFDKREVFEFPQGTSEQQARDAMADLLLQRAMERQAEYDARHPKRRNAKRAG